MNHVCRPGAWRGGRPLLLLATLAGLLLIALPRPVHAADKGLAPYEPATVAQQSDTSSRPVRSGLAGEFMCQCGCGLTLASCTHISCPPRDQMLAEIGQLQQTGRTSAQIRAAFIAQYGEGVLAAPLRRGFNLLAYWGPYWAIAAGALVILILGAAWVRRPKAAAATAEPTLTPEQRELLDRELRNLPD